MGPWTGKESMWEFQSKVSTSAVADTGFPKRRWESG